MRPRRRRTSTPESRQVPCAIMHRAKMLGHSQSRPFSEVMMKKILMLHGVNLNMFGKRDPVQYGTITLAEIDEQLRTLAAELGVQLESFQTNHEGAMCERIH